jgi:hypothetical protein
VRWKSEEISRESRVEEVGRVVKVIKMRVIRSTGVECSDLQILLEQSSGVNSLVLPLDRTHTYVYEPNSLISDNVINFSCQLHHTCHTLRHC